MRIRRWGWLLLVVPTALVFAQSKPDSGDDEKAVRAVVDGYLQGFVKSDFDMLAKAFHPDCDIFRIGDSGEVMKFSANTWFERLKKMPADVLAKMNPETNVLSVDVTGHAALVKTSVRFPKNTYTDFLTLLKSKGKWTIVTKTLSMREHARDQR